MSDFTHQNCCINVLDIILDTDKSNFGTRNLLDPYNTLKFADADQSQHRQNNRKLNDTTGDLSIDQPIISTSSSISHPDCLSFVPIALDDRRHLASLEKS